MIKKMELLYAAEREWMTYILDQQNNLDNPASKITERNPVDVKSKYSSTEITDMLNTVFTTFPKENGNHWL